MGAGQRDAVLAVLERAHKWLLPSEVAELAHVPRRSTKHYLGVLARAGLVTCRPTARRAFGDRHPMVDDTEWRVREDAR